MKVEVGMRMKVGMKLKVALGEASISSDRICIHLGRLAPRPFIPSLVFFFSFFSVLFFLI